MDNKQAIVDNWLQYPADTITPLEDVLTRKLNYYNAVMIERSINYHEALARFESNPNTIINTQEGPKTIEAIALLRLTLLTEIVSTVETAQLMLEAAKADDVSKYWTGDALLQRAITPERVKDEEGEKQA